MPVKHVKKLMKDKLYANSLFLMLNSIVLTGFGFIFWTINAKLFTPNDVGLATAVISAMGLIVTLSGIGLGISLVRYLPKAKEPSKNINSSFLMSTIIAVCISSVFLMGLGIFSPKLLFIKQNIFYALFFIFAVIISVVASLATSVFVAFRDAKYVLWQSSIFSVIKIILPFFLVSFAAFGIFGSWVLALSVALVQSIYILVFTKGYKPEAAIHENVMKEIIPLSFANYIATLLASLPNYLFPLIITQFLEPRFAAYYYVVVMMASLLYVIPQSVSSSLFAEGSKKEEFYEESEKKAYLFTFLILVPAIIVIISVGKYLLMFFGQDYSDYGSNLLVLLALSSILIAFKSIYISKLNIEKRLKELIFMNLSVVLLMFIALLFTIKLGVFGMGLAWVIGQFAAFPFIIKDFMNRKKGKKKEGVQKILDENPGFRQFLVKSAVLVAFFIILQFISLPFIDKIIVPQEFFTVQYIALGGVLMFAVVIFLLLVKNSINRFKEVKFNFKDLIIFGILGFVFHFLFFYTKYYISLNPDFALQNLYFFVALRYLLLALALISFAIAIFSLGFAIDFIKEFKRELGITAVLFGMFLAFSYLVQNSWKLLSYTITKTLYFFLSLTFSNARLINNETIGVGSFVVNIGKVCSGVESILLFTVLYILIFIVDKDKLDMKKMLLVFVPGIIGDFFTNILRIYLLMLVGIFYSPKLAIGIFHTNAGWVLFILYFFVFWFFAYPFVKKK